MAVTMDELSRLRQMVNNNPNDQTTQMALAEKLVEASSTLLPNSDQKSRDKARRKLLDEANRLLKRLIGYGSADAMFLMADCHGKGMFTPGPDFKEAFNMYQQAAKQNHAQAAYRLAVCCELGQDEGGGTRRDPIKAIQWYRRAATLGDTPAMYKIGVILLKGLLGQSRNPREAMQWLQKAAERADVDNPHAVHELARFPTLPPYLHPLIFHRPSSTKAAIPATAFHATTTPHATYSHKRLSWATNSHNTSSGRPTSTAAWDFQSIRGRASHGTARPPRKKSTRANSR